MHEAHRAWQPHRIRRDEVQPRALPALHSHARRLHGARRAVQVVQLERRAGCPARPVHLPPNKAGTWVVAGIASWAGGGSAAAGARAHAGMRERAHDDVVLELARRPHAHARAEQRAADGQQQCARRLGHLAHKAAPVLDIWVVAVQEDDGGCCARFKHIGRQLHRQLLRDLFLVARLAAVIVAASLLPRSPPPTRRATCMHRLPGHVVVQVWEVELFGAVLEPHLDPARPVVVDAVVLVADLHHQACHLGRITRHHAHQLVHKFVLPDGVVQLVGQRLCRCVDHAVGADDGAIGVLLHKASVRARVYMHHDNDTAVLRQR
eukprot:351612-Chlamydomonas_euryale.AAC.29